MSFVVWNFDTLPHLLLWVHEHGLDHNYLINQGH